jgi:aminopeptidase N
VPDSLVAVGNGRLAGTTVHGDGTTTWTWSVLAPINTYNLVPYVGKYVRFGEDFDGAEGRLDVDYWVLAHNEQRARDQFRQVPGMLRCFEHWLGPFPFRSDGYKLVESPHLGMEHQSAIAYGNRYQNGYLGSDLSGTGHGLKWDYILVHESGHEWFGNSITTADIADMWVHEGFTQYTEVLHTECLLGREAAEEYLVGLRRGIRNDRPIIGPYGVNHEGSGDMYPKGANVVHMVRHILNDDEAFRAMLRGMNAKYRHSVVSSAEIEAFMDGHTPADLRPLFDQYLRSNRVPELEWGVHKGRLWLRWVNCNAGFSMPVRLRVDGRDLGLITPTTEWHGSRNTYGRRSVLEADRNWYVRTRQVGKAQLKGLRATANGNPPTAF